MGSRASSSTTRKVMRRWGSKSPENLSAKETPPVERGEHTPIFTVYQLTV